MISTDLYTEREREKKMQVQNNDNNNDKVAPWMDYNASAEKAKVPLRVLRTQCLNL